MNAHELLLEIQQFIKKPPRSGYCTHVSVEALRVLGDKIQVYMDNLDGGHNAETL